MKLKNIFLLTTLTASYSWIPSSFAQDIENTNKNIQELQPFEATAQQNPVDLGMPTVSVKIDQEDLEKINFINP